MNAVASRSRRSVLAVPASIPRFIEKARGLAVDAFFLDLEDAVAPSEKERAREAAVAALNEGGWDGKVRTVRINDATTAWAYRDVITVVEGAGAALDCLVLPKVTGPAPILWLGAWEGRLAAFQEGAAAPVEVYDVFLAALPEADRQALLDRIPVRDEEELETLLQDLSP